MKTANLPKLLCCLIFGLLLSIEANAQKEANNWYFGNYVGLSFNSRPAQILTNGQTLGSNGFASISDAAGNLLFYSNGYIGIGPQIPGLYDRRHQVMPNSYGMNFGYGGNGQANLIVPWPGQPQKYFFFNQDDTLGYQTYSVIDMALNGGFGDVSNIKSVRLNGNTATELVAVKHRNNRDFWVIYSNLATTTFKSYLVSPAGTSAVPVVSSPVFPPGVTVWTSALKASPDGKTLAMKTSSTHLHNEAKIELFNFDAITGSVTYKGQLPDSSTRVIEFSPDGTKLYSGRQKGIPSIATNYFELTQYDLDAGTPAAIYNSRVSIFKTIPVANKPIGAGVSMQVGPDGKIYIITILDPFQLSFFKHLSVINRPNLKGKACRFIPSMIDLNPNNINFVHAGVNLPTFIQSYFYRPKITMQQTCFGDTAFFTLGNNAYVDSVEWNFGDPASGIHNTSTLFKPKHFYVTPGPKQVQAIVHFNFDSDTLHQTIYIPASITKPNFGRDTALCQGDTLFLNAYQPGATYEWQDSLTTDSVYVVTKPGTYWVSVSNGCGTLGDTITVHFDSPLSLSLPNDTTLCPGETLQLQVNTSGGNLLWSDSTSASTFTVSKPGTYWAELSNACGSWRDSIAVNYHLLVKKWLPKDTVLCSTNPYLINGTNPAALSYRWQDGSTSPTFTAQTSGTYWLEITTTNCSPVRDSIQVTINKLPATKFSDTTICNGDNFTLKAPKALSYRWSTGDTSQTINIPKAGNYKIELETVPGCFYSDSLEVKTGRCFKTAFIPNIITPNNDNLNDFFEPKGLEAGIYELSIYNRWGTLLYRNENYTSQWPDKKISDGTYYYLLRNKQTGKTYKGWVEVVK